MRTIFGLFPLILAIGAGCGASFPAPTQRMADAEGAARSARELGADTNPTARLQVKLAEEQIAQAKALMAKGDNERADYVLLRAQADAELGLALAREQSARMDAQKAIDQAKQTLNMNAPGARP